MLFYFFANDCILTPHFFIIKKTKCFIGHPNLFSYHLNKKLFDLIHHWCKHLNNEIERLIKKYI